MEDVEIGVVLGG